MSVHYLYRVNERIAGFCFGNRVVDLQPGQEVMLPEDAARRHVASSALSYIERPEDREITDQFLREVLQDVRFYGQSTLGPDEMRAVIAQLKPALMRRIAAMREHGAR